MAKLKGIKDKSETGDKIVNSKSGSWVSELQAKHDAEVDTKTNVENTQKTTETSKTRRAPMYRQSHHTGHSCMRGMVCITKDNGKTAIRVPRSQAEKLVKSNVAAFAPRSLWKATTRGTDAEVVVEQEVKEVKVKKTKKKKD